MNSAMDSWMTPKAQTTREKIDKLKFMKIENFYVSKDIIKKVKRQPTEWGKYLQIIYLKRFYYSEYIKDSYNSTIKIIS